MSQNKQKRVLGKNRVEGLDGKLCVRVELGFWKILVLPPGMPCELSEAGTCGGWGPLHLPDLVCSLGPDVGMGFVPEPSSGGSSHSKKEQRRGRLCPTLSCPGQPQLRLQLSPLKTTCFSDQTQPGRVPSTQKMLLATAGRQSHHRGARASPCPLSLPWLWASYCRNEATWLLHLSIILIPDEHGKNAFQNTIIVVVFCLQNCPEAPPGRDCPHSSCLHHRPSCKPRSHQHGRLRAGDGAGVTQSRLGPGSASHLCVMNVCGQSRETTPPACVPPGCQPWCPHMRVLHPCVGTGTETTGRAAAPARAGKSSPSEGKEPCGLRQGLHCQGPASLVRGHRGPC